MKTFETIDHLKESLDQLRWGHPDLRVGLVPTMGALHEGHLSLVRAARKEYDTTIVSLFVNPTQFNNPEDLNTYPRDFDRDQQLLIKEEVDILFAPSVQEIYPEPDMRQFDFGFIGETMEGKYRPGHFNGVAQIVSKLFQIVEPNGAFFGEKDFQQIAVISEMTRQLALPVHIHRCPIVREPDGLALSSRNLLLSEEERRKAPYIYKTLLSSVEMYPSHTPEEVRRFVLDTLSKQEYLLPEYYEIVDASSLRPLDTWAESNDPVGCVVCYCGKVRLIDNIHYSR